LRNAPFKHDTEQLMNEDKLLKPCATYAFHRPASKLSGRGER